MIYIMKNNKPMLKTFFLRSASSAVLLGLAGCAQTLTNITPDVAQRNPSNLYRFTTQCNVLETKVVPGSFDLNLVIDGEKHPLKSEELTPAFFYYDHILATERTEAKYYFELNYQLNNRGKLRNYSAKTPLSTFKIEERCCFCLDNERAPVGSSIKILGRGFTSGDRVVVGEYNAVATFESENVLSFTIPPVVAGKSYPVYAICNNQKTFVSNLLVDNSRLFVEPDSIEVLKGEKVSFTVETDSPVATNVYVNVTTDIPNSVIMPEVILKAGETSTTVEIEGGEAGKGNLFINAQGFDEVNVPIEVQEDSEDEEMEESAED